MLKSGCLSRTTFFLCDDTVLRGRVTCLIRFRGWRRLFTAQSIGSRFQLGRSFLSGGCIRKCWKDRWEVWLRSYRVCASWGCRIARNISRLSWAIRLANTAFLSCSYTLSIFWCLSIVCNGSEPTQRRWCLCSTIQSLSSIPPACDRLRLVQWLRLWGFP